MKKRNNYTRFIRALTCKIKFGAEKSFHTSFKKLWDYRPHTRILAWGKGFSKISDYMLKNELDKIGIERTPQNLNILKFNLMATMATLKKTAGDWEEKYLDPYWQLVFF